MEKKNIVYILGAGSSKDFGLPLGHEIFYRAYEILKQMNENDTDFKTIFRKVLNKAEADINRIYLNLPEDKLKYPLFEEVLSFIYDQIEDQMKLESKKFEEEFTGKPPEKEPLFDNGIRKVFDNFVNLMGLTILGSMFFEYSVKKVEAYERFIKSLNYHYQEISFISLNYDTIIDDILLKCEEEKIIDGYSYGIYPKNINGKTENVRDGKIFLLKPHGSLNLFFCPHKHRQSVEPGFYFSEDIKIFVDIINRKFKCPRCADIPMPLIIPPLYNKSIFIKDSAERGQPRGGFWPRDHLGSYRFRIDRKISNVLQLADEIVIIGYSMPSYDIDFKAILMSSLMENQKRSNVQAKIITMKENDSQIKNIKSQYEHLVGNVIIEGDDGFYNYLTRVQK